MVGGRSTRIVIAGIAVLLLLGNPAPAHAGERNHCVTPAGDDLNETFDTKDGFVAPFCTRIFEGFKWRPIVRIEVAGNDQVFPAGYAPTSSDLVDDFFAKFKAARYVVDKGTRREQTFVFDPEDLIVETGSLPGGTRFVRWMPRLPALDPGWHTVHDFIVMRSDYWDGLGTDPAANLIPEGKSLITLVEFKVKRT